MTSVELLAEIEMLLKKFKVESKGVNYGFPANHKEELIEFCDYQGFNIKIIVKEKEKFVRKVSKKDIEKFIKRRK